MRSYFINECERDLLIWLMSMQEKGIEMEADLSIGACNIKKEKNKTMQKEERSASSTEEAMDIVACPSGRGVYIPFLNEQSENELEVFCTFHDKEFPDFEKAKKILIEMGWPESALEPFDYYSSDSSKDAKSLRDAADKAYNKSRTVKGKIQNFMDYCNLFTADTLNTLGVSDLNDKKANDQIDYMKRNWIEITSAEAAQELANRGTPVVAGVPEEGSGHTMIVIPGKLKELPDKKFYPMVKGGGKGDGQSDGTKCAGQCWKKSKRKEIKYYAPPKYSSMINSGKDVH